MKYPLQARMAVLAVVALYASAASAAPLASGWWNNGAEPGAEWLVLAGLVMMVYMRLRQTDKDRR